MDPKSKSSQLNYQNILSVVPQLVGHLDIYLAQSIVVGCIKEVACVTVSVAKHRRGGSLYRSTTWLHRMIVH